jgi:hypothetical protein
VPAALTVRHCVEAGQDTIEHLDHFANELRRSSEPLDFFEDLDTGWRFADDAKERELIAALVAHKTKLDPTRVVIRNYSQLLRGIKLDEPEARFLSPGLRATLWSSLEGRERSTPEIDKFAEEGLARALEFVKRAHAAGVPILAGSDTPNPYVVPGISLVEEVEELAKAIGPEAALRSATLENARALGRADLGRIAPGTRADLVVLDEDPRKDARALRKIARVFVRGKEIDLAKLRDGLETIAREAEKAPAAGFDAIAGELMPGEKPTGPELRLEGRLGAYPPSFWLRASKFVKANEWTRVLRSTATLPVPYTFEERLSPNVFGGITSYHAVRDMLGERREVSIKDSKIQFKRAGKVVSEAVVPDNAHFELQGGLLLYNALDTLTVDIVGAKTTLKLRNIDLDKFVVGEPRDQVVRRVENPIEDATDPRAAKEVRVFELEGDAAAGIKTMRFWIKDGLPLGFDLELAFGKFEARAAKKKYY